MRRNHTTIPGRWRQAPVKTGRLAHWISTAWQKLRSGQAPHLHNLINRREAPPDRHSLVMSNGIILPASPVKSAASVRLSE
jgi:hypothetical protein